MTRSTERTKLLTLTIILKGFASDTSTKFKGFTVKHAITKVPISLQIPDLLSIMVVDFFKSVGVVHLFDVCQLMCDNVDEPSEGKEASTGTSENNFDNFPTVPLRDLSNLSTR